MQTKGYGSQTPYKYASESQQNSYFSTMKLTEKKKKKKAQCYYGLPTDLENHSNKSRRKLEFSKIFLILVPGRRF